MSTKIRMIGAMTMVSSLILVGGCADMRSDYSYVVDSQKVQSVNHAVRNGSQNIRVIWVNPPVKKVEKKSD